MNFLFYKTKDPAFLLLSYYYIAEEFNSFLDLEIYSKEYYEVKKLYDEIIRKYNDSINKNFNFTNPIEVSQAYNFAYKNGFLSKDKEFSYITDKNKRKIKKIISLPSADFDFIDTINDKTQKLCNDNLDTFIDFYLDNQYVYDEITEKLKKISM